MKKKRSMNIRIEMIVKMLNSTSCLDSFMAGSSWVDLESIARSPHSSVEVALAFDSLALFVLSRLSSTQGSVDVWNLSL